MSAANRCVACSQRATTRCSACHVVRFCSTFCQKLIWPTHKVLCGRDINHFYMPPLTSDEIERVEAIKHDELVDARIPIRRSLWRVVTDGSKTEEQREWCWTESMRDIGVDLHPDPTSSLDERLEGRTKAYYGLAIVSLPGDVIAPVPSVDVRRAPWYIVGRMNHYLRMTYLQSLIDQIGWSVEQVYAVGGAGHGGSLVLNRILRHTLVAATLQAQYQRADPLLTWDELYKRTIVLKQRAMDEVDNLLMPVFNNMPMPDVVQMPVRRLLHDDLVNFINFRHEAAALEATRHA